MACCPLLYLLYNVQYLFLRKWLGGIIVPGIDQTGFQEKPAGIHTFSQQEDNNRYIRLKQKCTNGKKIEYKTTLKKDEVL